MTTSWGQSFAIHLGFALFFWGSVFFMNLTMEPKKEVFEIPIQFSLPDEPVPLKEIENQKPIVIKSVNTPPKQQKEVRQVFGASRNSLTAIDNDGENAIDFKKGNTLAKDVDTNILTDDDIDALPQPTEEYLVSQMPQVLFEVRPLYPEQAKAQRLEGNVVLNVLVDDLGEVRQVEMIEGEDIFGAPAVEAMKKFKFKPATMEGRNVAVRIRYTLRFVLEN